jgi:hypothetical protein
MRCEGSSVTKTSHWLTGLTGQLTIASTALRKTKERRSGFSI